MTKREVVVLSGVRTAIGTYGGSLKGHHLSDLAGLVVREAITRAGVNANEIGHSVFGHVVYSEPLAVAKDLDIPTEKLNPNGSGISLGHPIGATGAVITVKALHELQRIQGRYAAVSLCIGGGQGIAALFERI